MVFIEKVINIGAVRMKQNKRMPDTAKWLFMGAVFFSFISVYFYNMFTPYMSDDLLFDRSLYHSFADVIKKEYWQYHNWTGRSVLQIILKIAMLMPKSLFDIVNSLGYVGTVIFVYLNIKGKKQYDVLLYVLINLCMWTLSVEFSQTILWVAGACNYLWGMFIILGFITLFKYYLWQGDGINHKIVAGILLFVTGVAAGWCNENTSGGAILILLLLGGKYYYEHKKIEKVMFTGLAGMFVGFLFMLLAPGNAVRGALVKAEETYSGLAAYVSRGLKVMKAVDEHLLIYIIVICLLGTYFYYSKKYRISQFTEVAIFTFAALATAGVLVFTPEPMARAYFGANIYMMIAALQMIQMIREEDTLLISLKNGGILAALIAMVFIYVEEGANLVRIRREINTRESYIIEERAKGESDLTLPALRSEFASKYSMAHLVDISNDEENWNNDIYRNAYLLDEIIVLPWDEWEENLD